MLRTCYYFGTLNQQEKPKILLKLNIFGGIYVR